MFSHIHHVQLAMPEGMEASARDFFGVTLGMAEVPKPSALKGRGGVWFRAGGVELHLGCDASFMPARKAHPALAVDDLGALKARLDKFGVSYEIGENLPDFTRVFTHDPFGNRIEIVQII